MWGGVWARPSRAFNRPVRAGRGVDGERGLAHGLGMRPPWISRLLVASAAALASACGGEETVVTPPFTWRWIEVAGTACSDGSVTGIGVEEGPSRDVVLFLDGGGACWDFATCWQYGTAAQGSGPFGFAQFDPEVRSLVPGSLFDRTAAGNPYKDFTFVFVPYCTGDVHAGDTQRVYSPAAAAWHHRGRANLAADLVWLGANLPAPSRVVVTGSSAGGFGALLAFDLAKKTWAGAKGYLVDDSGPPLREIPQSSVYAWYASWDLAPVLDPLCGTACKQDLSLTFTSLRARYPDDRLALLSSTQDSTMRWFYADLSAFPPTQMPAMTYENGVRALAAAIEDDSTAPPGETHAFVVAGTSHTMLGNPGGFSSQGMSLWSWLGQQVGDDPAWAAKMPP